MGYPRVKYLNNRDILKEIHESKKSYGKYLLPEYADHDITIWSLKEINDEKIEEAKKKRVERIFQEEIDQARKEQTTIPKEPKITVDQIKKEDLIFRLMTFTHIPVAPGRKKTPKTVADKHEKVNFPPYQHWKFNENGDLILVGKSHWKGDLVTGEFCLDNGKITNNLGNMIIKLCEKYGSKGNFRNYTYNDEMQAQAIIQLSQVCLQFDESRYDNPFAYFTTVAGTAFLRILTAEKKQQEIRDDLLEINGLNPSWTRMNSTSGSGAFLDGRITGEE